MDLSLLPHSVPENIFPGDYELYPKDSGISASSYPTNERAAQFQWQLAQIKDSPRDQSGYEFAQYTPWTDEPVSTYHAGFMNPCLTAPGSDYTSSPWSTDLSSISDPASPRNDWRNLDYGCYPSPPYSYDESGMSHTDFGGFPTADDLVDSSQSVALCQVQHYPDPDLGVKLERDPTVHVSPCPTSTVAARAIPYDDFDTVSSVSGNSPPLETTVDPDIPFSRQSFSPQPRPSKPAFISRRGKSSRSTGNRICKRQSSRSSSKASSSDKGQSPNRVFVCSFSHYGCESTFSSKNEWKRHVASQHLQLGFYRCDLGSCNTNNAKTKPSRNGFDSGSYNRVANDFNRKDLFTQHQRRMHAPWMRDKRDPTETEKNDFEQSLDDVRARCWHEQRKPPLRSRCGFCGRSFVGPQSWDERMEHVGRHFEKDQQQLGPEAEDVELRKWAVDEGLVRLAGGRWRLNSLYDS